MGRFSRWLVASVLGLSATGLIAHVYAQTPHRPPSNVPRPAQAAPPAQGGIRGENFSNKAPALLFASDCTGAGCHRSPQGLAKGQSAGSLASFLREHYTNSRESAASLANYLTNNPVAVRPPPSPSEPAQPNARTAARPNEQFAAPAAPGEPPRPPAETGRHAQPVPEAPPATTRGQRPDPRGAAANARLQRGRGAPPVPAAPEPPPPPPPPQPQFDIFD